MAVTGTGDPTPDSFGTVGVLGAGVIGLGVAADLALHGFRVNLVDNDPAQCESAPARLAEAVRFAPMLRPGFPVPADRATAAVRIGTDPAALTECTLIVENVTERLDVKEDVYRLLDTVVTDTAVIAVNTSSIPVARLAAHLTRPERVIGVHFMNPPHLTAAVEVMRPDRTSDETLARVGELATLLRKKTIVVGDFPGFVSNRISHLFFNEAARVVEEHGVAPETVDRIFRDCFGHRMGPLQTADLIGLDTVVHTLDHLREATGDPRFDSSALLRDMVRRRQLGRKTDQGFYTYQPHPPREVPS
ncbi:3-hydroxyacyl-CoA dehydrogenase family protein [Streptomyces sp. NP-1717]|uniref:3-hydroxyacyl-CoA dehydrogenase family protein n=1 Tax=unclassified Streptomyces TaxID=2593676 RepID=UPI001F5D0057|nr:3-hydroxyacyl-CoA dehydrogenase family protein [Streptomyces sp. NP-1717]MCI3226848.1 3-hydroxyacyl-CoA dehydrogenase family protein [Streptomyces sp. NP-1717]WTA71541.1 3-hydroxyacyl-CoA dehydrogenase family protein [Streptomyces sp. NBC_00838]